MLRLKIGLNFHLVTNFVHPLGHVDNFNFNFIYLKKQKTKDHCLALIIIQNVVTIMPRTHGKIEILDCKHIMITFFTETS